VTVTNDRFTSYPLVANVQASQLFVDGKAFPRLDPAFMGPPGLGPEETWQGCFRVQEFVPNGIAPGKHHLRWQVGEAQSPEIRVKIYRHISAATTPQERWRQAKALAEAIVPGVPRSCVENWLKEKDGGLETTHAVRYYLDPDVKVVVSYDDSTPEPRVAGPVKFYVESRVAD